VTDGRELASDAHVCGHGVIGDRLPTAALRPARALPSPQDRRAVLAMLTSAVRTQTLRHVAETAGHELVLMGHGSTIEDIRDRLRWDAAYCRLRQGL
jgi:hypothetical protein